jgi:FtsP/CotA-like multicopper oxidase with cupredoxin domain
MAQRRSMISRRAFLRAGTAGAVAASTPSWLAGRAVAQTPPDGPPGLPEGRLLNPRTLRPWKDALPVPPQVTAGTLADDGLAMAPGAHRFHSDLPAVPTWGYGIGAVQASYLGPTVRARRGQPITFTATNDLGRHPLTIDPTLHGAVPGDAEAPRTSLHHHGGYTEPGSDGYPEDTFVPGEDHVYRYSNDQQAGPTWFHDHALGITRLNVYAGLAAAYLIEDEVTDGFSGVPASYGVDDFPLVLQDKAFDRRTGALHYPAAWVPEFFGNVPVVNGAILPNLSVGRGLVRLRLLNGSSSRFYRLSLSNPRVPVFQIATDTGYKPSTPLAAIELAPVSGPRSSSTSHARPARCSWSTRSCRQRSVRHRAPWASYCGSRSPRTRCRCRVRSLRRGSLACRRWRSPPRVGT